MDKVSWRQGECQASVAERRQPTPAPPPPTCRWFLVGVFLLLVGWVGAFPTTMHFPTTFSFYVFLLLLPYSTAVCRTELCPKQHLENTTLFSLGITSVPSLQKSKEVGQIFYSRVSSITPTKNNTHTIYMAPNNTSKQSLILQQTIGKKNNLKRQENFKILSCLTGENWLLSTTVRN